MKNLLRVAAVLLPIVATPAGADVVVAPPQNVINLTASATVEVMKDQLTVVFSTTREGQDATAVQSQLKVALEAALAEVKKVVRPVQLEVQTGNFSLFPRYSPKGAISGWVGSAEMIVQGRDTQGIAQLTAKVPTMSIARVNFSLSREALDKVEADVTAQAIARYRAKAEQITRQFGFGSYTLRELQVNTDEGAIGGAQPMYRAQASRVAEEPLPVEPGKAHVTTVVSGSVQLSK